MNLHICLLQRKNSVVNLSAVEIEAEKHEVIAHDINYHLKNKFELNKWKAEIEIPNENVMEKVRSKRCA